MASNWSEAGEVRKGTHAIVSKVSEPIRIAGMMPLAVSPHACFGAIRRDARKLKVISIECDVFRLLSPNARAPKHEVRRGAKKLKMAFVYLYRCLHPGRRTEFRLRAPPHPPRAPPPPPSSSTRGISPVLSTRHERCPTVTAR